MAPIQIVFQPHLQAHSVRNDLMHSWNGELVILLVMLHVGALLYYLYALNAPRRGTRLRAASLKPVKCEYEWARDTLVQAPRGGECTLTVVPRSDLYRAGKAASST